MPETLRTEINVYWLHFQFLKSTLFTVNILSLVLANVNTCIC